MTPHHHIALPESLYQRLQTLASLKGQTVDTFVQEALEETIEGETDEQSSAPIALVALPDPDQILPPYGSEAERALRQELATVLNNGPSLSQIVIDDRGER